MSVINLETGQLEEPEAQEVISAPPQQVETGKIIDLNTGAFVEPTEPRRLLGAPAARKQEEAELLDVDREPTRAVKELPELAFSGLLSEESISTVSKIVPALLTTTNPREMGDILTANFPHIGIIEDEQGNLIAANNKTGVQAVINKPGASAIDVLQTLGIGSAFVPGAQLAGAALKIGVPTAATVGATTAGLTQAGLEGLQAQAGGEFNKEEVAIATVLGGAAELVLPAINAVRQARQSKEIGEAVQATEDVAGQVKTGIEAAEATDIPLFQAQQTAIPAQLEKQSFLAQLPAGTQRASKELAKQNRAASNAVDDFLAQIAPDEAVITGPEKLRAAAEIAVKEKFRIRKEASSPIYKQAFRRQRRGKTDLINTDGLQTKITEMSKQFDPNGQISINLNKALKKIENADGNLQKLHLAKTEIDQTINSFGQDSVGNTTKRFLADIQRDLTDELVKQSPSYRAARDEFIRLSPPVNKIQESIIGKIAALDDTQLKNVSKRIFDPAETNPEIIKRAKKIIQDVDPDAWNAIFRSEIERRIGSIRSTLEAGTTENVPGQIFNAMFGNTKQRRVLFNAVDGDAKKNLKFLETALSRARLGRPGGSQTAIRGEIIKELKGGMGSAVRDFFQKPISTLVTTGEDAAFNARVRALTDVMFDPQWKPRVNELRKLSPNSPAAARAMVQLLDDALVTDITNISESDQLDISP